MEDLGFENYAEVRAARIAVPPVHALTRFYLRRCSRSICLNTAKFRPRVELSLNQLTLEYRSLPRTKSASLSTLVASRRVQCRLLHQANLVNDATAL